MTTTKIPPADQYWQRVATAFPPFLPEEQRAPVTL
jgi:hypothetical protein